jgi:hypothetical protein
MSNLKLCLVFLFITGILSCKKPSVANNENEHEAINKVELIFTSPSSTTNFVAEDPDGDGGMPPTRIDTIKLTAGQTYDVQLRVINMVSGVEKDITPTIVSQGRSHEVFFITTGASALITKTDRDLSGYPIGIRSSWVAGATASGSVLIKLMHKTGIKGPSDSPDLGHSDLQLAMPLKLN